MKRFPFRMEVRQTFESIRQEYAISFVKIQRTLSVDHELRFCRVPFANLDMNLKHMRLIALK